MSQSYLDGLRLWAACRGRPGNSFYNRLQARSQCGFVILAGLSSHLQQDIIPRSCMPRNGRRMQLGSAEAEPECVFMQMRPGSAITILIAPAHDANVTAYEFPQFGTHPLPL